MCLSELSAFFDIGIFCYVVSEMHHIFTFDRNPVAVADNLCIGEIAYLSDGLSLVFWLLRRG